MRDKPITVFQKEEFQPLTCTIPYEMQIYFYFLEKNQPDKG